MLAFAMGHLITVDSGLENRRESIRDLETSIHLIRRLADEISATT